MLKEEFKSLRDIYKFEEPSSTNRKVIKLTESEETKYCLGYSSFPNGLL